MDLDGHYPIWRCIGWTAEDGGEETGEIEVCGVCVPKHSSFPNRETVPEWPQHRVTVAGRKDALTVTRRYFEQLLPRQVSNAEAALYLVNLAADNPGQSCRVGIGYTHTIQVTRRCSNDDTWDVEVVT